MTEREILAVAATDQRALIAAGWTPSALRTAGWTPSALIAAGWTPSDLRAAGWTPSALIAAGWTPSALRTAGWTPSDLRAITDEVPLIDNPYTRLLSDLRAGARTHKQSTFGPDQPTPEANICNTPMCTAGHLVSMAGKQGWKLRTRYGWEGAARLIHDRAHPGWPPQNYRAIPGAWALAWIETMAEHEKNGTKPLGYVEIPEDPIHEEPKT